MMREKSSDAFADLGATVRALSVPVGDMSGGQKQSVAVARAASWANKIIFLDEPTAGLDPIGAGAYDELIRELQRSLGLTVFMVTHDLDSLYAICDRIAVLSNKRVLVEGPIEMMTTVDDPWVQEYFTGPRARAAQGPSGD